MKKQIGTLMVIVSLLFISPQLSAQGYKLGDKATDFSLRNVDGKMVSLKDYNGSKGFIVVFTCNHCPFSKAYESRILDLDKKYAELGYPVIAINSNDVNKSPDDSFELMQELAKEKNYSFPYLYDETQEIAKNYGATRTPHAYILRKESNSLIVKYIGAIDDNADEPENAKIRYIQLAVDALISGNEVTIKETKAIGCTIKWKD